MVSSCNYDILFASLNVETPLRYEVNYRNYFVVTNGKVIVRLLVPKSKKYLYATNDYDNFEFISPVNPWNVQDEYRADFNKLRTIDVTLITGQMIHIPAYWWYSIKFVKSNTTICVFKYKTYMNTLAISNHLVMRLLQGQNTKRIAAKKMNIVENKKNNNNNNNNNHTMDNNVDNNTDKSEYVSILMSDVISQDNVSSSSVSLPLPNDAIPIPYDINQKASNTLDTENTLGDDVTKKKPNTNNNTNTNTNTETDIVINL
jgi:hypothetical protein